MGFIYITCEWSVLRGTKQPCFFVNFSRVIYISDENQQSTWYINTLGIILKKWHNFGVKYRLKHDPF